MRTRNNITCNYGEVGGGVGGIRIGTLTLGQPQLELLEKTTANSTRSAECFFLVLLYSKCSGTVLS